MKGFFPTLLSLAFQSLALHINYHEEAPLKGISVIEGRVFCQSCKDWKTWYLSLAKPIPFAKVGVTCLNHDGRIFYYKQYTANKYGYFFAKLEGHSLGHYHFGHIRHACTVKLVSSPLESCNVPTKFNGFIGASLRPEHRRLTKKNCDDRFYDAGVLAFCPALCT